MIGTEEAARGWWCPRTPRGDNDRCVTTGCAAWRWIHDQLELQKTGVLVRLGEMGEPVKEVVVTPPAGDGWQPHSDVQRDPETTWRDKKPYASFWRYWSRPRAEDRLGYCGAYDKP